MNTDHTQHLSPPEVHHQHPHQLMVLCQLFKSILSFCFLGMLQAWCVEIYFEQSKKSSANSSFSLQDLCQPVPHAGENQVLWLWHGLHPRRVQVSRVRGSWLWVAQEQTDRDRVKVFNFVVIISFISCQQVPSRNLKLQVQARLSGIDRHPHSSEFYSYRFLLYIQVRGIWWDSLHGNMLKVKLKNTGQGSLFFVISGETSLEKTPICQNFFFF